MKILVTGGAGFIGSALIRHLIANTEHSVLNIDKLTYAGNLDSLTSISNEPRYVFQKIDICDREALYKIVTDYQPDAVMHLAAESHVDRSIAGPDQFIQTNIVGTYKLLEVARAYLQDLDINAQKKFRFHHVSTDEVYGDLEDPRAYFTEETAYAPSSPYSATKASSDHLVRAWHRTYGLPIVVTNCSNNYGPYQYPEKLIPVTIFNALEGKPLPVYGSGLQVRDWLYVEDHVRALCHVLVHGSIGSTYNIGGHNEMKNIDVIRLICAVLDEMVPSKVPNIARYEELITYVKDRPGHDLRYAIDAQKIQTELGWTPQESFETAIRKTISWYLDHQSWCHDRLNNK